MASPMYVGRKGSHQKTVMAKSRLRGPWLLVKRKIVLVRTVAIVG